MSKPSPSLVKWIDLAVTKYLPQPSSGPMLRWQKLSGDAGSRQYFRLDTEPSTLAVLAPPETENNDAFVAIAQYLRERGVQVPKVIAYEPAQGFMLIEDLGNDLLLDHLNADTVELLYGEALMSLLHLQQQTADPQIFPHYSQQKLRSEMNTFSDWFVGELLDYSLTEADAAMLDRTFQRLEEQAGAQPTVIVHRDFHSRNLLHRPGNSPGVIDFQDAVVGPITYDLVSLLRDCYIKWPAEQVEQWALAYANMARDVGILEQVSPEMFMQWFDWMGLQRHIKVLGVFARLSLRDGKHGYLADLPRVVYYVRSVAQKYRELDEFMGWFDQRLLPLAQRQTWYSPVE